MSDYQLEITTRVPGRQDLQLTVRRVGWGWLQLLYAGSPILLAIGHLHEGNVNAANLAGWFALYVVVNAIPYYRANITKAPDQ